MVAKPGGLVAHALRGIAPCRTRVTRARPVCVEPELLDSARTLEPAELVFSERGVGRADQRDDVEAAGPRLTECSEATPCLVVERSLEVAGDDSRARHTAAEST